MPPKIVVVTGPTATGKTRLAVALAKDFDGEIVSADSMQVYRRMDIGTAKVTPAEAQGVPHRMIDVAEPYESYSVARYVREASACVDDILARGKLPILAGGTNLYIDSLVSGRDFAENEGDNALRERLGAEYDESGGEAMLERLRGFDPERAAKLHPADRRRIIRAIEVYMLSGRTITQHDLETKAVPPRYDALRIALDFEDRAQLYGRIDRRVDEMMEQGLLDEVKKLVNISPQDTSVASRLTVRENGYKEPAAFLRGEITRDEAIELIKRESRRYAKRQLTWLRRDESLFRIRWGDPPDFNEARRLSTEYLHSRGL